jgi:hypothetical protein
MGKGYTHNSYGIEWSTGQSGSFEGSTPFVVKEFNFATKLEMETIVHAKPATGIYQLLNRWNIMGGGRTKSWIGMEI